MASKPQQHQTAALGVAGRPQFAGHRKQPRQRMGQPLAFEQLSRL
jgi:hypothetical protein